MNYEPHPPEIPETMRPMPLRHYLWAAIVAVIIVALVNLFVLPWL